MKIELCCCIGAFLWALVVFCAWAICAVGGRADEMMEKWREEEVEELGTEVRREYMRQRYAEMMGYK